MAKGKPGGKQKWFVKVWRQKQVTISSNTLTDKNSQPYSWKLCTQKKLCNPFKISYLKFPPKRCKQRARQYGYFFDFVEIVKTLAVIVEPRYKREKSSCKGTSLTQNLDKFHHPQKQNITTDFGMFISSANKAANLTRLKRVLLGNV